MWQFCQLLHLRKTVRRFSFTEETAQEKSSDKWQGDLNPDKRECLEMIYFPKQQHTNLFAFKVYCSVTILPIPSSTSSPSSA